MTITLMFLIVNECQEHLKWNQGWVIPSHYFSLAPENYPRVADSPPILHTHTPPPTILEEVILTNPALSPLSYWLKG